MKKKELFILSGVSLLALSACQTEKTKNNDQPNVIFILADDLGYGDLSCFGQERFSTPNIDKMASNGMRFTSMYSGCTVSAPSRCSLLTGLHTGHTQVRGNKEMKGRDGQFPMRGDTFTMAKMFQQAGYATGAFGKWGLGYPGSEGDPNMQGFDEFFGYNCQRRAHRYYPEYLYHNQEKVVLKGNDTKHQVVFAPDLIHEKALDFIRQHKDKPFFAYVPIIQPHAELIAPDDEILAQFKDKYPETPYKAVKPGANYGDSAFDYMHYCDQEIPHATFAAMVTRVDRYVGEIMNLLVELGIDDNTLVVFTSDNGPHLEGGADPDFFNGNGDFNGYKRDLTDGGIRVPMIATWSNKIAAGTTTDMLTAFWDFLPTFAEMTQSTVDKTDGLSILPTLLGQKGQAQHDYLYWENRGNVAVRFGQWKGLRRNLLKHPDAPLELYNLKEDVGETNNIADKHPDIAAKAIEIIKNQHTVNKTYPLYSSERKNQKN